MFQESSVNYLLAILQVKISFLELISSYARMMILKEYGGDFSSVNIIILTVTER